MNRLRPHPTLLLALLLAGACDALTGEDAPVPARLVVFSGNQQTAAAGTRLNEPLVAQVQDRGGRGIPGQKVTFRVVAGGGELSQVAALTDDAGRARAGWTLGRSALSPQTVEAMTSGGNPLLLTFSAVATPAAPSQLARAAGDGQQGVAGEALEGPLSVRVLDQYGNAVPGASVAWAAASGGGTVTPRISQTGADGVASARLTLGPLAGPNQVSASVGDLAPVAFTATSRAGAPARLLAARAQMLTGTLGGDGGDSVAIRAVDAFGNPVPGVLVWWEVRTGGGSVSPSPARTEEDGVARAYWTFGVQADATQTLVASSQMLAPVTFTARTVVPSSAAFAKTADGQTGAVGQTLAEPIAVTLRLSDGRPVPGVAVTWVVTAGGGRTSAATTTTDEAGRASVRWTLGGAPGLNSVSVSAPGIMPVTFSATARSGAAARLAAISGDGQIATAGTQLPDALSVRVTDAQGNPVAGESLEWVVLTAGGTVSMMTASDAQGVATARWKLSPAVGENRLEARLGELPAVRFTGRGIMGGIGTITSSFSGQSAVAGDTLPQRLAVLVRHSDGRPAANLEVTWSVTSGGGSILSQTPVRTDADGVARALWRLGAVPGTNTATATVLGMTPATFTATGTAPVTSARVGPALLLPARSPAPGEAERPRE